MILGNGKIRLLYNQVITTFNDADLPIEVKKLIAEAIFYQIQIKADEVIREELNTPDDALFGEEDEQGNVVIKVEEEVQDGITESLSQDKLGELSE